MIVGTRIEVLCMVKKNTIKNFERNNYFLHFIGPKKPKSNQFFLESDRINSNKAKP